MESDPKGRLRRILEQRRSGVPPGYARDASARICDALWGIGEFASASSVALYHPKRGEVRTQGIMEGCLSRGIRVLLPRVSGDCMTLRAVEGPQDLARGRFGIMEPMERCPEYGDADVVVVPVVGVTRGGHRLGRGRGYYDRLLASSHATFIAPAYSWQVVGRVPQDPHDIRMHWVVTEKDVIQAAS